MRGVPTPFGVVSAIVGARLRTLPFEWHLQRLEDVRALMQPRALASSPSRCPTSFAATSSKDSALTATHRTTEEFLRDLLESRTRSAQHRALLSEFLHQCDLVKFAGVSLTLQNMESLHQSACDFVRATARQEEAATVRRRPPVPQEAHDALSSTRVALAVDVVAGRRCCGAGGKAPLPPSNIRTSVWCGKWPAAAAAGSVGWLWLLPVVAAGLMIVALARPQRMHSRTEVTVNGIDIVLGLDVSGSMQALDFTIDRRRVNRIEVVKSVVSKFIEERPNDRIGLIAFAGVPFLVSPMTLDHDWLQQNLERVSIGSGDDGTAIGSAIAASVNRLRMTAGEIEGGHSAHRWGE